MDPDPQPSRRAAPLRLALRCVRLGPDFSMALRRSGIPAPGAG